MRARALAIVLPFLSLVLQLECLLEFGGTQSLAGLAEGSSDGGHRDVRHERERGVGRARRRGRGRVVAGLGLGPRFRVAITGFGRAAVGLDLVARLAVEEVADESAVDHNGVVHQEGALGVDVGVAADQVDQFRAGGASLSRKRLLLRREGGDVEDVDSRLVGSTCLILG
jgi:hypothetical protein